VSLTGHADTPPISLLQDALQSDTSGFIFQEQSTLTLAGPATVNTQASGTYTLAAQLVNVTIPAGTVVDAYLMHFDIVSANTNFIGSVTFARPILGVFVTGAFLNTSNPAFGVPGVSYASSGRAVELNGMGGGDTFTISPDLTTFSFNFRTNMGIDEVRFLTSVPEPGTWGMMLSAAACLIWLARKKHSAASRS
jgi:hypothetical protein